MIEVTEIALKQIKTLQEEPKSSVLINGLVLDYSGGLNGTGFTFKNPNALKSCGFGTSFAV